MRLMQRGPGGKASSAPTCARTWPDIASLGLSTHHGEARCQKPLASRQPTGSASGGGGWRGAQPPDPLPSHCLIPRHYCETCVHAQGPQAPTPHHSGWACNPVTSYKACTRRARPGSKNHTAPRHCLACAPVASGGAAHLHAWPHLAHRTTHRPCGLHVWAGRWVEGISSCGAGWVAERSSVGMHPGPWPASSHWVAPAGEGLGNGSAT